MKRTLYSYRYISLTVCFKPDTFVLIFTILQQALQLPVPSPRFFASAVSVQIPRPSLARATSGIYCKLKDTDRDVYLLGGKFARKTLS